MASYIDVLREYFPSAKALHELPRSEAEQGLDIETLYTHLVDCFRIYPNPRLSKLARRLWDVVHFRHVHVASFNVPTLTFTAIRNKEKVEVGVLLVPPTWVSIVEENPLMQLGAVLFTGSQAVDFYNQRLRFESPKLVKRRAWSYEAELLKAYSHSTLNEYQRKVLADSPLGFEHQYDYVYKDVAASTA